MNKAIRDLPLNPSRKHPGWQRHQRNGMQQPGGNGRQPGNPMQPQRPNMQQQMTGGQQQQGRPGGGPQKQPAGPKALPPLPPEVENRFISQVNQQYKGKTLAEKCAAYRELAEAHAKGDGSVTAIHGIGRTKSTDYFGKFREAVESLPQSFDEFVPASLKKQGDSLLLAGRESGYDVDSYAIGKMNDYSRFMRGGNFILYHQYVQHQDHGEELLRRLSKLNLEVPYQVTTSATSVMWKDEWGEEPEVQLEQSGEDAIGRSVQYAIAFQPRNKAEADKLVEFFERNAKHDSKDAIPHSWFVPDIRSSFKEKVDEFQKNILNIKKIDDFELLLLKKRPIRGFDNYDVWLNPDLSAFVKSLAILVTLPYRIPIAIGSTVNKGFTRLRRIGNLMIPVKEAHG